MKIGWSCSEARETLLALVLLLVTVALLYAHTLQVPFYLDDLRGLVENYRLRDLSAAGQRLFSQRGLTNLTFALNYRLTGWALPPLHLVNILLHAGCGILVWRILLRLLPDKRLPLLGSLLFIAHPLQTQGVTYLVQRATVLAAFFAFLAFLLFLQARGALAQGVRRGASTYLLPYLGAVLAGACAVLAKENTASLPLVLLAYDRLFPLPGPRRWRQSLLDVLPFCGVPLLLGVVVAISIASADVARVFHYSIASLQHNSPLHYLVTQFSVLWIYLRLLVLPYGQALEHNYPIVAELVTLQSALALAGLSALGWGMWRLRRRQPLLVFGVVWFFLALLVESSVIPLDPLFEHRLYLPLFGCLLAMLAAVATIQRQSWVWLVLGMVLLIWGGLAWQRNDLWNHPIAFYEQNLRVAPDSERACKSLGTLYEQDGRRYDSFRLLERAVANFPENYDLYGSLANHYAELGQVERALALLEKGMATFPECPTFYEDAAKICKKHGNIQRAIDYIQRGLAEEKADKGKLLNALGLFYSDAGASVEAEQAFLASLAIPAREFDRAHTYWNLAREYYYQQRWQAVFSTLQIVLALTPGDPNALARLGEMAIKLGDRTTARQVAEKLEYADPQAWLRLETALRSRGWLEIR